MRFWSRAPHVEPLAPLVSQRLAGWLDMLDGDEVDVELAQRMLRLPVGELPVPPVAMPAVRDAAGLVLVPAVDPPRPDEPEPVPVVARRPMGAYARRAAARG